MPIERLSGLNSTKKISKVEDALRVLAKDINPMIDAINKVQAKTIQSDVAAITATAIAAANAGATYTSAEQTLINELKTDLDALRSDVIAVRTVLNDVLAKLRTAEIIG